MIDLFRRIFGRADPREAWRALYTNAVTEARHPQWYTQGAAADSVEGRFEVLCAVLSLLFIRLEGEAEAGQLPQVMLTELFVSDIEGQMREDGMGDAGLGKHMGRMMSGLGGRIDAYRNGLVNQSLDEALIRNFYRGETLNGEALEWTKARLNTLHQELQGLSRHQLQQGAWAK